MPDQNTTAATALRRAALAYDYDYLTLNRLPDGAVALIGWKPYERSSVLAGQMGKHFIACYDTEAEARDQNPGIEFSGHFTEPQVSVSHLPGEDDPVPGGMYPDDRDDGL